MLIWLLVMARLLLVNGPCAQKRAAAEMPPYPIDQVAHVADPFTALGGKIGQTIPKDIDDQGDKLIERMSRLRGNCFDHAFIHEILDSDKKELAAFQHEAQYAQNPNVKEYASGVLPALKLHLYEAQGWVKYGGNKKQAIRYTRYIKRRLCLG